MKLHAKLFVAGLLVLLPTRAYTIGEAVKNLQTTVDQVKSGSTNVIGSDALSEQLKIAESVIEEGKKSVADLKTQITALENEKAELVKEKTELQQVETTLTSGLIGAVVTAIVAVAGALLKVFGSRADRDLKRLEVVKKVAELRKQDISIPQDISRAYETKDKP